MSSDPVPIPSLIEYINIYIFHTESTDNEVDDMELSGDDSSKNGSDNSSENDMDDDDQSEASDLDAPHEKGVTKKSSRQKQTDSTSEKQKNQKLTNKPKKTVTFGTGASKMAKLDKGKPGHGKDQSAKSDKRQSNKRQHVSDDDEDMSDTGGDNEDGVDDDGQDVSMDSSDNSDSEGSVLDSGEEKARSDEESSASDSDQANIEEVTDSQIKLELKEDIYGRLRDTAGQVVDSVQSGGYIPPAKRLLMAKSVDEKKKLQLDRMKKQLQGLINRYTIASNISIFNTPDVCGVSVSVS